MRSRRLSLAAGQWMCFIFIFCITSLTQSDTSPSDQLEIGRSNQTAVSAVKEIISSPNKESTVVKEYLSYISPAPVFKQEPLPSTSPAETIPASVPEELQKPPTKLDDLTLGILVAPIEDDADASLQNSISPEILAIPPNQDSSIVSVVEKEERGTLSAPGNVPNVNNDTTRANESGSSQVQDEIPSFSEWTQKVLAEEEKSGANGSASVTPPAKVSASAKLRQKNYASPDCGAKILAANSEAEHTGAILDPSRDEYFLSICSAKIWFVIELCEAIQAQRVEIANFELFSSSPKDFRVFISDRYPTRDWALLGQFAAADERSIQSFTLERQLFGKFVKVELVSHFGKEHFCPISLFRVYGNSEYEVLDIEEGSRAGASSVSEEDSTDEEMLFDMTNTNSSGEVPSSQGGNGGRNLFGSAKDAVINIVKKAAEALGSPASPETVKENNQTESARIAICHTAVLPANVSRAINGSLSCEWNELTFLATLSWLHSHLMSQCRAELPISSHSYMSVELAFAYAVWSPSTIQALCHWISLEVTPSSPLPLVTVPLESVIVPTAGLSTDVDNLTSYEPVLAELEVSSTEASPIELVDLENLERLFTEEMEVAGSTVEDIIKLDLAIEATNKPSSSTPQVQQSMQQQQQQKESVFVRLSNRIKVLERNMSLSGQYLEELSRRYKRQVDDMQKSLNRTLQTLNETMQRMNSQDERYQTTLNQLLGDISELKTSTERLTAENLSLRNQVLEQHLLFMVLEVIIVAAVVVYLVRRPCTYPPLPPNLEQRSIRKHRRAASASSADFRLEVGQQVQEVVANSSSPSLLTLDVAEPPRRKGQILSKASPAPSLADSTSSGCESAFSFPNSNHAASRDPSPVNEKTVRLGKAKSSGSGTKKNKKKKSHGQQLQQVEATRVYHVKDFKSSPPPPPKIRLKPDNWEWGRSRAKILAVEFIKENCEANALRSSI